MIYENTIKLTGIIISEPVLNCINEKTKISNFIIKTVNSWVDKKTNERKVMVKKHKVICWDLIAEKSIKLCKKGNLVSVIGEISYNKPKTEFDNNGKKLYSVMEIKAIKIQSARLEKTDFKEFEEFKNNE
jgi:single-stranded DNA-binding protein